MMRFQLAQLVLALSSLLKLQVQSLCRGIDLENAIIEQKVMENIKPFIVELMKIQHQQTSDECLRVCGTTANSSKTQLQQDFKRKYERLSKTVDENAAFVTQLKRTSLGNTLIEDFPIHMSETTLNSRTFLSLDRKSLFNSRNPWTNLTNDFPFEWPIVSDTTLVKYYGVKGSLPIKHPDIVCFELDAYYRINFDLTGRNLLFEFGVGRESAVDNSHYIGWELHSTWSFVVARDDVTGRVKSACQSQQKNHGGLKDVGNSTAGTHNHMALGVRVNMADGKMTVMNRLSNTVICDFSDVDVTLNLWPMFGVYAKSSSDVVLTLRHSFLLSSRIWIDL
ncbi:uncharacterized protein LOC132547717 [Ylistrum balloti]|uniref:uncharacterized protein LOC132547717 n=1 Tax=Ylistrum balloti TaxID=509963 RepID=UPI002905C652|nr:uncharacterized protein LOC132547717 [Ylistrum balloti]